jgi:hypothetical protein
MRPDQKMIAIDAALAALFINAFVGIAEVYFTIRTSSTPIAYETHILLVLALTSLVSLSLGANFLIKGVIRYMNR